MVFGFGKNKGPLSAADQLQSGRWQCGKCDEWHGWPFDLAASIPSVWPHGEDYKPNGALRFDGDFLSEDFCVMDGKYFMVRCVLPIPVIGVKGEFAFGCWSTLSRQNFDIYLAGFDSGEYADTGPWTGWLMNGLADFSDGEEPVEVYVEPQPNRQRPRIDVAREGHPLSLAQVDGITAERMLEVFAFYGHGPK